MRTLFVLWSGLFLSTAFVGAASRAAPYQDPGELSGRAEGYGEAQRKAEDLYWKEQLRQEERKFQASGGREPVNPATAKAIARATGQDMSQAYWQSKRMKNGKYSRAGGKVLITRRGFYCFQTNSGFTFTAFTCYYDNGAPYVGVIQE